MPASRRIDHDEDWADLAADWQFRPGITYLNHGSFGPSPRPVFDAQIEWQRRLRSNPMDFYVREYEAAYFAARARMAAFVGVAPESLVFVENATYGMNVVANSFALSAGDEVLLTDHEYGAVLRVWKRKCEPLGAKLVTAKLPYPLSDVAGVVDAVASKITSRTRLLVFSHVTSPTATILPAAELCQLARSRNLRTCIDGPHAVATLPLDLKRLGCDYYTASCHKWLCAPLGTGFLYVDPRWHEEIKAPILSWGRIQPALPERWYDEFVWQGTRETSGYLSVPAAIDYLDGVGLDQYRARTHWLARYGRAAVERLTGRPAFVPDDPAWYGSMIALPLPDGDAPALQKLLRNEHGIEIPVIDWQGRRFIRISAHLYNTTEQIDRLVTAIRPHVA
jgi:isopenicillin-N epimerase